MAYTAALWRQPRRALLCMAVLAGRGWEHSGQLFGATFAGVDALGLLRGEVSLKDGVQRAQGRRGGGPVAAGRCGSLIAPRLPPLTLG